MTENEFLLQDRIAKIKSINETYNLENNAYISLSGGKDSTILSHLVDMAIPKNKIPRLFLNTGIEYKDIYIFVKNWAESDKRIEIVNSMVNIKDMLERVGYPFKSKEHSSKLALYQKNAMNSKAVTDYLKLTGNKPEKFCCPDRLKYQFTNNFKIKISSLCCNELKKKIAHFWENENNKTIKITGMRKEEGGARNNLNCIVTSGKDLKAFHPLAVVTETFEDWFVNEYNIQLCRLYYPPFNFKRTGCKGCPYNPNLQEQLMLMENLLPDERKQCEIIWKPVYDEYRRIGYRLEKEDEFKLFDF